MIVELHFQDGFSGETVEVEVDGTLVARFVAKTRYQINLAHIEAVELAHGQTLTIRLVETGVSVGIPVVGAEKYYEISNISGQISVNPTDELPKYL